MVIEDFSQNILQTILNSKRILLHCHPFPDPDSIGSVLAMANVLKSLGKDFLAIGGDSNFPESLKDIPGYDVIQSKKYVDVNIDDFDTFIILDSSSKTQITQLQDITFPDKLNTIVIDHHRSNQTFGKVNLVLPECCSTCQVLYDLFLSWNVEIEYNVALYLILGIFGDTGGFRHPNTTPEALQVLANLVKICPDFYKYIFYFENSKRENELEMSGLALSNISKYCNGKVALSVIPFSEIQKRNLTKAEAMDGLIAGQLRAVKGWDIVASLVEAEENAVTISLRTRDQEKYDMSEIARFMGANGGGHRGAAGVTVHKTLEETIQTLIDLISSKYPEDM